MKESYKLLTRLVRLGIVDVDYFYVVEVSNGEIRLQCKYSEKVLNVCKKLKMQQIPYDNKDFIKYKRNGIRVVIETKE